MANLGTLAQGYDRLVLLDTETTGLNFTRDEIIQLSALVLEPDGAEVRETARYDTLVSLSPGGGVPPFVEQLTGISESLLRQRGVAKAEVCRNFAELISGNALILAYNAHFDLSFLYYMLLRDGDVRILRGKDKLDLLTVYRDRHPYPHKLCSAIETYGLGTQVVNSHSAMDDVVATLAVAEAMAAEKDDLRCYVNLFGYHPKYGVEGKPIGSVTYLPQSYQPQAPLYQLAQQAPV